MTEIIVLTQIILEWELNLIRKYESGIMLNNFEMCQIAFSL